MMPVSAAVTAIAPRVSSSMSATLRHSPSASAISNAASATQAARRITRRGSSSGAAAASVDVVMREILRRRTACREVFPSVMRRGHVSIVHQQTILFDPDPGDTE
jgi:hypothetical protein